MGVPALFRWLSNKYPKIISPVIEERPYEVNGEEIPVDTTAPNPNGEEMDNLYLDMNGIVHPCTHPEGKPPPANEQEMMLEIFKYTDRVVNMVRPRKLLLIAVDGVAPRAKMNQQRARRFRSSQEARLADEKKEEFRKLISKQNRCQGDPIIVKEVIQKTWDSNVITPGTPFMDILAASLRYWVAYKLNTDPAWEKLKIIISDATVPGEGEHKIMEFIRSQRAAPEHDPNTRHVIYGLDADLIMLGLGTHEPHFRVLREDVFFQESRPRTCHLCGQPGHKAEECRGRPKEKHGEFDETQNSSSLKPFIWLHVSILREYLAVELFVPNQPFSFDLERALDDWVFLCFFVGNDFLPHLPSLDIRENGIDTLIAIWRDNIPAMGGYLTQDGHVDLKRAQFILQGLAKQEDSIFRRRRQVEERKLANEKRREQEAEERARKKRRSSPTYESGMNSNRPHEHGDGAINESELITPSRGQLSREARELTRSLVSNRGAVYKANMANKSAASILKSKLLNGNHGKEDSTIADSNEPSNEDADQSSPQVLGKRKADLLEDTTADTGAPGGDTTVAGKTTKEDELPLDTVRLWEEGYADRYYEQKFGVEPNDMEFRHKVAKSYAEGLCWVLLYYFQGCPSWTWYYPYHYAPFAADFVNIGDMEIKFDKGKPFKPFEQLMGVLPASSNHAIPEVFHDLMKDPNSEIIDFYPEEFAVDLNGKKFAWQGVVLLPFIDESRLLAAMEKKYPLLSEEERIRNTMGQEVLLISDRHPLYQDLVSNFYSKKAGAEKYKLNMRLSEGLAGKVRRCDTYIPYSCLSSPLENYGMPSLEEDRSLTVTYEISKSIHVHKSMLLRGVKFRPSALDNADKQAIKNKAQNSGRSYGGAPLNSGHGRGGRVNYAADRPNPFAAHLDPNFVPPSIGGSSQMPVGWIPPLPGLAGYSQGPPPPPLGVVSGSPGNSYTPQMSPLQVHQQHNTGHGQNYSLGGFRQASQSQNFYQQQSSYNGQLAQLNQHQHSYRSTERRGDRSYNASKNPRGRYRGPAQHDRQNYSSNNGGYGRY